MAEYIERERAIQKVKNVIATEWFRGNYEAIGPLQRVVDVQLGRMTAADVAPVVHGKWKATGTFKVADYNYTVVEQRCSACGHCSIRFKNKAESNYCPKCGAKMDGGETEWLNT